MMRLLDFFRKKKIDSIVDNVKKKTIGKRYFMLILGCLIVAFAFNLFFLRYNIVCFGISGLSIVFDKYGVNPSGFIMIANIILLIIAYFVLGKKSAMNQLVGAFIYPIFIEITKLMGLTANLEVRRRDDNITIKIFSDHNAVLIGKNGSTIEALQTIIRQIIQNETKEYIGVILDVENYKDKRIKNLEYLAKRVAKEVKETQVETKLDSMNSYERRIIHSTLSDNKYVYTESVGEEPNRCVVVKPKGN